MTPVAVEEAGAANGTHILETKSTGDDGKNQGDIIRTPLPNPCLQTTADHRLKQEEGPVRQPRRGEVLLHVKATGVCGSDVHFWKKGRIGTLVFEGDCTLGHEAAGVVLKCGEDVSDLRPGDRVAIEPGVPCDQCFLCQEGRYNLCEDVAFIGVYPYAGSIQRYMTHPAKWLHKLPENVSFAEGALLEPLSVVLHGIRTGGLSLGIGAVICGAGPIGLIALLAARASGAHPLVITDVDEPRLEFAKKLVPSCATYHVDTKLSHQDNAAAIRQLFRAPVAEGSDAGAGTQRLEEYFAPRTVLECTGVESSICTAAYTARRGGTVCVIGVGESIMNNLPFMHLSLAEIDLKFINRYRDTWPPGISCLSGGILDLKPLISHVFPLERAQEALEFAADRRGGSIKVQIVDEVEEGLL